MREIWRVKDKHAAEYARDPKAYFAKIRRIERNWVRRGGKIHRLPIEPKKPKQPKRAARGGRQPKNYFLCLRNDGYVASLETRKVYPSIPDRSAKAKGFVRIIDESGEDYLYSADRFMARGVVTSNSTV
jgi:hypothetical protein